MFLMTPKGHVNSLFVKTIEHKSRTKNGKKQWYHVAIDVDGREHEIYDDNSIGTQLIPGSGKVLVISCDTKSLRASPTLQDLYIEMYDIVSWLIYPAYEEGPPIPITLFGQAKTLGGILNAVEQSNGTYIDTERGQIFKSKEDLLEAALRLVSSEPDAVGR